MDDITAAFIGELAFMVGVGFVAWTDVRLDIISSYTWTMQNSPKLEHARHKLVEHFGPSPTLNRKSTDDAGIQSCSREPFRSK